MSFVRRPPSSMDEMQRVMDAFFGPASFERVFRRAREPGEGLTAQVWSPAVDIAEDASAFHLRAELPSVKKDEVKLTVEDGVLTLSGERSRTTEDSDTTYHRIERSYGRFVRRFTLPEQVDVDQIAARFEDGVLHVDLPKVEPPQAKGREVAIQ